LCELSGQVVRPPSHSQCSESQAHQECGGGFGDDGDPAFKIAGGVDAKANDRETISGYPIRFVECPPSEIDGTRAYLHAVIDNYSSRILSWTLEERLGSGGTCRILRESILQLKNYPEHTIVVADSGSENVNGAVEDLLDGEELTRVLAQVEITFSNSMIEAFWRSLRHSRLYLHSLNSFAVLRRLTEFYVTAHNEVMPHSAFEGQTPDEIFFGTGDQVTQDLAAARINARDKRIRENRAARCGVCVGETSSGALLLQRPRSRMS
jgi:putative transposase